MNPKNEVKAWAYVRDFCVPPSTLICQMTQLLNDAEQQGIPVVGMSQDHSSGKTFDRIGLKSALHAICTGYANTIFTHDVCRLSEDGHTLLRIMEVLQDNSAVLICSSEDAYTSLREKGISPRLYQRAMAMGLRLPWRKGNTGYDAGSRSGNGIDHH